MAAEIPSPEEYLTDGPLAMAFLDRLVEGAIILKLKVKGKSYRARQSKEVDRPAKEERGGSYPFLCAYQRPERNHATGSLSPAKMAPLFHRHRHPSFSTHPPVANQMMGDKKVPS